MIALYALYEAIRGFVAAGRAIAVGNAAHIASLERSLHIFVERNLQQATMHVPTLLYALGFAYITLHLAITGALLLWLHRCRPNEYPFVRTTVVVASALALIGYVAFPTAPPRLAGLGILDTVSGHAHVNLNRGLVSTLYNPYAAVPSMHAGYALIVGATVTRYSRQTVARLAGCAYPAFVVLVIIATGNHFLFDALAGAFVSAIAAASTACVFRQLSTEPIAPHESAEVQERLAA